MLTGKTGKPQGLWIRAASFPAMRDLVTLILRYPSGLSPKQLWDIVTQEGKLRTGRGHIPSKTTLYHYRNILLHLGVLKRRGTHVIFNEEVLDIKTAKEILSPYSQKLSEYERLWFIKLVLNNQDCRKLFFDLFMPGRSHYHYTEFVLEGMPVVWHDFIKKNSGPQRQVVFRNNLTKDEIFISTEDQFQAILYGLRFWTRDELEIIDEIFCEDIGYLMFPISKYQERTDLTQVVIKESIKLGEEINEWVIFSVRDIARKLCPEFKMSVLELFNIFRDAKAIYPQYIVFIPTSRSFATITAINRKGKWSNAMAKARLRSYLVDDQGRFTSHIRIHRKLTEVYRNV